ncbi:hypothetical protein BCR36DRAFT_341161 [Piromyces finnis]|uniref:Uncharacterized protein n=1 Tax=Piromyces finnis TaxID=1754191 RepID=A0A1Y1VPE3_9FUNG|nr:hypothetical protein BCR36DRAFT_341161 [Piromyces finnis]|eukprot:ORX61013.1 hypothetical protein BCR36DRAFT_341161 [Piromyces finnis]
MTTNLKIILNRLLKENLHPPTILQINTPLRDDWVIVDNKLSLNTDQDLDYQDPRWCELFREFFLESSCSFNDDLLLFVRQPHNDNLDQDPVFVKRKINNEMPTLSDIVLWKDTFFLNLISQLPCRLTASICCRKEYKDILYENQENKKNIEIQENIKSDNKTSCSQSKLNINTNNLNKQQPQYKGGMWCVRRTSRKVYAVPYKSSIEFKETTHECSYPNVYYTLNNFEDEELQLPIQENEYLCVELAVLIPDNTEMMPIYDENYEADKNTIDSPPFGCPPNHTKIVLFQGSVSFKALFDAYVLKGMSSLSFSEKLTRSFVKSSPKIKTEYIMMRGPNGKGHCRVAITDSYLNENLELKEKIQEKEKNHYKKNSFTDKIKKLTSQFSPNNIPEEELYNKFNASMTSVNVRWETVIEHLYEYAKKMNMNINEENSISNSANFESSKINDS